MSLRYNLLFGSLFLLACCFVPENLSAQASGVPELRSWKKQEAALQLNETSFTALPSEYFFFVADTTTLKQELATAPAEILTQRSQEGSLISLPDPDGNISVFEIVKYEMMEPELAAQYPHIQTYRGQNVANPEEKIRLDWTELGFHAMVRSRKGSWMINPVRVGEKEKYIVFDRSKWPMDKVDPFICGVQEADAIEPQAQSFGSRSFDCNFRTYRLAQATTAEYSNFFGATSAAQSGLVLSAVVTSVNRVNGVYEFEMTVRLILIANTTAIFYYNPSTDPYTNGNGSTMLGQNQITCDNVIGSANYDIGHVFSTGGGGVAVLNAPCNANNKARGVTGRNSPVGDPFDIDYVAHEMGHQFGGSHTFNNSCSGNRSNANAYEPGSGSTIMAYAGICNPNVQPNSDAYMHGRSVQQINTFIQGSGNSCASQISFSNQAPSVDAGPDKSIPLGTPFILTANASDPNGNAIVYGWEQFDNQVDFPMPPSSSSTGGPMFRSLTPDISPSRYFPNLTDVVAGNSNTWEVLPEVARTMNFRVTVRDIAGIGGCQDFDNMVVNVANSGPFVVNEPNGAEEWTQNQNHMVLWDVAGTTAAPVSCSSVDILLSTDGGFTYPFVLATGVPNSGSATVQTSQISSNARIMVRGNGNIFYDISDQDFSIVQSASDFTMVATPSVLDICEEINFQSVITLTGLNGFQGPVALQLTNLPIGISASVTPASVGLPGQSTLNVNGLDNLSPGSYSITVVGTAGNITRMVDLQFEIHPSADIIELLAPGNGDTEVSVIPVLSWIPDAEANSYEVQVALNASFSNVAYAANSVASFIMPGIALPHSSLHYWRVRGISDCGEGQWSEVFTFTTVPCLVYESTDVPVDIPAGPATILSTLEIEDTGLATDINMINLAGLHTQISDLEISLISPAGHRLKMFGNICPGSANFQLNFDDQSNQPVIACPPTAGLAYEPVNPFGDITGIQISGTWTLEVKDLVSGAAGRLDSWALELCPAFLTILPIEWLDFQVKAGKNSNSAELRWTVLEDAESAGFEIERSIGNAKNFEKIGTLNSRFTDTALMDYYFEDKNIPANVSIYYRIRHIDLAGSPLYSEIRQMQTKVSGGWTIYPNPGTELIVLQNEYQHHQSAYRILNMSGQIIQQGTAGKNEHIAIDSLPKGMFLIQIFDGNEQSAHRFVKQ